MVIKGFKYLKIPLRSLYFLGFRWGGEQNFTIPMACTIYIVQYTSHYNTNVKN